MKLEIRRLPPRAAARIVGALVGLGAFLVTALAWLAAWWLPGSMADAGPSLSLAAVLVPLGWWLSAYLYTLLACGLYNLLADRFGGLVIEAAEAGRLERNP